MQGKVSTLGTKREKLKLVRVNFFFSENSCGIVKKFRSAERNLWKCREKLSHMNCNSKQVYHNSKTNLLEYM